MKQGRSVCVCVCVCVCDKDLEAAPDVCVCEPAEPPPAAPPSSASLLSAAPPAAAAAPPGGGTHTPQETRGMTARTHTHTYTHTHTHTSVACRASFRWWCFVEFSLSLGAQRCTPPPVALAPPSGRLSNLPDQSREGWRAGPWRIDAFPESGAPGRADTVRTIKLLTTN